MSRSSGSLSVDGSKRKPAGMGMGRETVDDVMSRQENQDE